MNTEAADGIWKALRDAIQEIHNQNASSLSFEELYRNAYNLVLHKHGDLLFHGVKETVTEHLQRIASKVACSQDDQLLSALSERWAEHKVTMVMIRDILMYMDRTYVIQNKKTPVYDLGLQIFRETIARHVDVKDRLQSHLLSNIELERTGQVIDRNLMKNTLSMLVELGIHSSAVYEEDFEQQFLEATRQFYIKESQEYLVQNTCPDYMRKAEARLMEEHNRVQHYLNSSTDSRLKQIVETELIQKHAAVLIEMENSGCVSMFKNDKIEDLSRMYSLFGRVPSTLNDLRASMSNYVKHMGSQLVSGQEQQKNPVGFVQDLLNLRDKYDVIVNDAFRADKVFQKSLKEAFEVFINTDSRVASYLAQYVDDMLRSRLRGCSEDEVEARLDKVIVIFRYLQDKDVFENYYKQHLAKRLLSGRSVSDEAERNMIAKLKNECGYQFTSKLEGMFTDMKMSKETMDVYRKRKQRTHGMELNVHVLTTGFWPTQSVPECQLPPDVQVCCEDFKSFYFTIHQGRRLAWQTNMGNADVKATFRASRHELNVSTYQMCILMLFNKSTKLSLDEIKEHVRIQPETELRRHLISLCTPKFRILHKKSKGKIISDDDEFTLNQDFKSKLLRVRIPLVAHKETSPMGSQAIPAPVMEDRRHLIEAAIVRIMKTRKTLQHNNLIAEVTKQLSQRFVPTPQQIKKRIESLIEREYLERTRQDRRIYNYLA